MNALTFPGEWQMSTGRAVGISQWYAVRTATRREKHAAEALAENDVTVFLPLTARWGMRSYALTKTRVETPLMPGYLFVLIGPDDLRRVLDVDGVHAFVGYIDETGGTRAFPIPQAAIIEIQADERAGRYDQTLYLKPKYNPRAGDKVKIIAGPWLNFIGKVIATPKGERAHVMIEGPHGRGATIPSKHLSPAA